MAGLNKILLLCCLAIIWAEESFANVARSRDAVESDDVPYAFVTLGASGDLAKRKIYPALWLLYRDDLLPPNSRFYGYARGDISVEELRERVKPFAQRQDGDEAKFNEFWKLNSYIKGTNNADADYDTINKLIGESERNGQGNRIFYMALPPSVFPSAASQIKRACMAKKGATRVVVEKPFGHDSGSFEELSKHLSSLFTEDQIYLIDHYLGKEMVQNMMTLRFANRIFEPSWNKDNIAAVEILFEENLSVEGRGAYFDQYGIIRDVMQNHLLQVASLIAMEKPVSGHSNDIRDAKVNLLKQTKAIVLDDVVLGQYVGNPESSDPRERVGYREDPTVPDNSITPTFALTVLRIDNERWRGVPFIMRAGKGLGKSGVQVTIQFKDLDNDLFKGQIRRDELVLKISKGEALQMRIMSKKPGITSDVELIDVDFVYEKEFENLKITEPYERLILDIYQGSQMDFVRTDELFEAWRIFTPVLHELENKKVRPIDYKFGSRGPVKADAMEKINNFL